MVETTRLAQRPRDSPSALGQIETRPVMVEVRTSTGMVAVEVGGYCALVRHDA